MSLLTDDEIKINLSGLPGWERSGDSISKTFASDDFPKAILFVGAVAQISETAWHHPDIDIRWNKVTLTLSTHDQGGLTEKDFALAAAIESVAPKKSGK